MAKKQTVSKTQAVRDYLKSHAGAMSGEIAKALTKNGIKINPGHVANIKTKLNKESGTAKKTVKKAAKKEAPFEAAAPAVEKAAKAGDTITLELVKKVAHTIKAMGGFQRMTDVLEVIKEAGGVKKFKDLAEAMSDTAADAIPF